MSDEVPNLDRLLRKLKFTTDPEERKRLKNEIALERIKDQGWGKNRENDDK